MQTVAFCEIDPFCRRVLAHHWPEVPIYEDVRTLSAQHLTAAGISVDVICGGFPCQDISFAGKGAGLAGERSGLWSEYARLIGEIRPQFVIVENVAALLGRGLGDVLGDLAAVGYDAEWHCIPASAIGAPHRRDRLWLIAYPKGFGRREGRSWRLADRLAWLSNSPRWNPSNPSRERRSEDGGLRHIEPAQRTAGGVGLFDAWGSRWPDEPALCGVDDGPSAGVDVGLFALGNSLVPQIPAMIGRAIMETVRNG